MTEPYTPTTDEVRADYIYANPDGRDYYDEPFDAGPDFDRWLAEHDREVKAEERGRILVGVKQFVDDLAEHGGDDPTWSDLYEIVRGIETGDFSND